MFSKSISFSLTRSRNELYQWYNSSSLSRFYSNCLKMIYAYTIPLHAKYLTPSRQLQPNCDYGKWQSYEMGIGSALTYATYPQMALFFHDKDFGQLLLPSSEKGLTISYEDRIRLYCSVTFLLNQSKSKS